MALVACEACKAEISDAAAACPKCGHPMAATKVASKTPTTPASQSVTAKQGIALVVFMIGGAFFLARSPESSPPKTTALHDTTPAATPKQTAAEAKEEAERSFKSDARLEAEMQVHKLLVKQRGNSMPENWKEEGEMIKREGDFALVIVRTGIKEGWTSPLVVVQS